MAGQELPVDDVNLALPKIKRIYIYIYIYIYRYRYK